MVKILGSTSRRRGKISLHKRLAPGPCGRKNVDSKLDERGDVCIEIRGFDKSEEGEDNTSADRNLLSSQVRRLAFGLFLPGPGPATVWRGITGA
jgi:hypothetical protein